MTGVQTCALRSEEHTSELQSHDNLVCRLLLEKKIDASPVSVYCGRFSLSSSQIQRLALVCAVVCLSCGSMCKRLSCVLGLMFVFFFFIKRAPPKFSLFPHQAPLRF